MLRIGSLKLLHNLQPMPRWRLADTLPTRKPR